MVLSGTLSHRKPVTYGKRSRTHMPLRSPRADDEFGANQMQIHWGDTKPKKIRRAGAQLSSKRSIINVSDSGARTTTEAWTPSISKSSPREQQSALIRPKTVQITSLISSNSEMDTLYDVPSSNEERGRKFGSHGPTVGKRRKTNSVEESEEAIYVYDDQTLQQHIAIEVYNNSKQTLPSNAQVNRDRNPRWSQDIAHEEHGIQDVWAPKKSQSRPISRATPKPSRVAPKDVAPRAKIPSTFVASKILESKSPTTSGDEITKTDSSEAMIMSHKPQRLDESHSVSFKSPRSPPEKTKKIGRRRSRDMNDHSSSLTNSITQPQTPPQTPPRSLKSVSGTATPRQPDLWGMLLKEDSRTLSPDSLDLPNLKIISPKRQQNPAYRSSKQMSKNAARPLLSVQTSRRRLVDNLQRVDEDDFNTPNGLDETTTSDDNYDSSDGQFQAPTKDSTFLREGSQTTNAQSTRLQACKPAFPAVVQPLSQAGSLKVTYARQRSYLTDEDLGEVAMFNMPITRETTTGGHQGYRRIRATAAQLKPAKVQNDEMDEIESSQGGIIRSIHELREAGGTVRLISEMETTLDEINEQNIVSVPLKRTTLLDLAIKLQDTSFCHLFVGQGLESRLLASVGVSNDIIIKTLYTVVIWHLLLDQTSIQTLPRISAESVINHLVGLLDNDCDLAQSLRDRELNMSKLAQLDFKKFFDSLINSPNWRAGSPPILTLRALSLHCLECLVRQTRETGSDAEILTPQAVKKIVKLLRPTEPSKSMHLPAKAMTVDLQLAVSVLESFTLVESASASDRLWTGDTLDTVVDLLPLLVSTMDQAYATLRTLLLRLYLNITNNNAQLCKACSRPNLISAVLDIVTSHFQYLSDNAMYTEQPSILDNLILSLGFLVNLAEWCDDLGHMVLQLRSRDATFLDNLLAIFMANLENTGEVGLLSPTTT